VSAIAIALKLPWDEHRTEPAGEQRDFTEYAPMYPGVNRRLLDCRGHYHIHAQRNENGDSAMANNTLDGRKVLVMPNSPEGLFGPHRRAAVETMALLLSAAIADSLDRIHMFNRGGQPVLLIDGALRVVNNQMLAWILEGYFATPHVVENEGRLELEHRGVVVSEMVLRHMLTTEEAKYGGLLARLPRLVVERARAAVEEKPGKATLNLPEVQAELEAGAREVARRANDAEQTRLETEQGARVVARHEGRQVAVETPVEESIPVFAPAEANDVTGDPTSPPRA
jgi:hypothetical protein